MPDSPFPELISDLNGRRAAYRLIAALGLTPELRPVSRPGWSRFRLDGLPEIDGLVVLLDSAGLAVLLIELAEPIGGRRLSELCRRVRDADALRRHLLLVVDPGYRVVRIATFGLEGDLRHLAVEPTAVRATDVETLEEMVAAADEGPISVAARWARALDRSRVTSRFFLDFRGQRAKVAEAWSGIPDDAVADREPLALLFLCRIMFLYFLQHDGHLVGDRSFMPNLFRRWRRRDHRNRTFFRGRLDFLFFGALNTRPEYRSPMARSLGDLPYLNGGLFERTAVEQRYPGLDLPDSAVAGVFDDLFERYRFNSRDSATDLAGGGPGVDIDPEMLGRVFEGVMAAGQRGDTGTFYTPAVVVDDLVSSALSTHLAGRLGEPGPPAGETRGPGAKSILRDIRVLDPACGSGAFLLGALSRLAELRVAHGERDVRAVRRDVIARSLHGVDLQADAALLCALRLWLALTVTSSPESSQVEPLPNLDRRIRQGDALLDPLDLTADVGESSSDPLIARVDPVVHAAARALTPLALRYVTADPADRTTLQRELMAREATLARAWLTSLDQRLRARIAELRVKALQRDFWGEADRAALDAGAAADRLESERHQLAGLDHAVGDSAALPFFSFGVHFAEATIAGFDLVLTNPPWVRASRWPVALRGIVRARYKVCRHAGWSFGTRLTGTPVGAGAQVDLALLFLERSLSLLADRGTLGILLPAKSLRSLYGGQARAMLLRETRIAEIADHGLDQRSIFKADSFAASIVATRCDHSGANVRVRLRRRAGDALEFELPQTALSLVSGDPASPWLLVPPEVHAVFRRMQAAGAPVGLKFRVRRGIFTGANDVLLVREVAPRLGGLAWIRAEGRFSRPSRGRRVGRVSDFEALVESNALVPVVRGAGVSAWRFNADRYVIWSYDERGRFREPPARVRKYLDRHRNRLVARSGARDRCGTLFRVSAAALGPKVVWHDLADRLKAVAVPGPIRTPFGRWSPVVPLNTVYYMPVEDERQAFLMAAFLNSLPVRAFARAIAERAKDARFRFFAWTVAVLPMPAPFDEAVEERLVEIGCSAHRKGAIDGPLQDELDALTGRLFGLDASDLRVVSAFDQWLSGIPS